MNRLRITATPIAGLLRIERDVRDDARGSFGRMFCAGEVAAATGSPFAVAQVNVSRTRRAGTLRGLHFQKPPHSDGKIVNCLRGAIFDVAVDLRRASPTYLRWHGEVLSAANGHGLLVPKGCAHGFQALEDDCELVYLHDHAYVEDAEGGIDPFDTALAIDWPLPAADVSERDRHHPALQPGFAVQ